MNLEDAKILCEMHMEKWLDPFWTFAWDDSRTHFGLCRYRAQEIVLSRYFTQLETEEHVEDTILHEIAHALAPGAGHGRAWKIQAMKVGATPRASASHSFDEDPNWAWVMVFGTEIIRGYYRKPNKSTFEKVKRMWLRNRKEETKGKLELVPFNAFKRMR